MSSYKKRRIIAEDEAERNKATIKRLVEDFKKTYSLVKSIESQINRIQNLTTMLMVASMGGVSGGISKPLQVPEVVYLGHPFLSNVTLGGVPAKFPSEPISGMINLGIVTAIIPIIFQVATMVASEIARREASRIIKEFEARQRGRFLEVYDGLTKDEKDAIWSYEQ